MARGLPEHTMRKRVATDPLLVEEVGTQGIRDIQAASGALSLRGFGAILTQGEGGFGSSTDLAMLTALSVGSAFRPTRPIDRFMDEADVRLDPPTPTTPTIQTGSGGIDPNAPKAPEIPKMPKAPEPPSDFGVGSVGGAV